ncbi:hypothetical protein CEXT_429491 [Caerostris extrusa]|uniref:Uncharacterized protein n=1 Tax=Caerostris extrusa TaxID=172846 RepID=A0AAV4XL03_CAEEX|nr:hypothetical protein CEXT_429491 [Caerostris extrusa]
MEIEKTFFILSEWVREAGSVVETKVHDEWSHERQMMEKLATTSRYFLAKLRRSLTLRFWKYPVENAAKEHLKWHLRHKGADNGPLTGIRQHRMRFFQEAVGNKGNEGTDDNPPPRALFAFDKWDRHVHLYLNGVIKK